LDLLLDFLLDLLLDFLFLDEDIVQPGHFLTSVLDVKSGVSAVYSMGLLRKFVNLLSKSFCFFSSSFLFNPISIQIGHF
jgi:hypothetical protein